MKKCLISFFAAVLMISSCVKGPECELKGNFDEEEVEAVVPQTQSLSISAGNLTKSSLGDDGNIWWEKGDKIAVVFPHPDPDKGHSVGNDFTAELEENTALRALFKGTFLADVSRANGYDENAYAIYPNTAVDEKGQIVFELPSVQTAVAGGSFMSGYNITSAPLSLSDIEKDGYADTDFKNVLSYFRFTLDNAVKSVTFTGTTPLAGRAPLQINFSDDMKDETKLKDHGRLMIGGGEWINGSNSVTLMPEEGYDTFQSGGKTQYNLLVWPGIHDGLTITLDYGEPYGKFELFNTNKLTFKSNKYYNLNFPSDLPTIMSNVEKKIVITEGHLNEIENDLSGLEGTVDSLLNQVQSISLMTEYLDNAAYAPYSKFGSSNVKQDIELSYMIRPVAVAQQLVEKYSEALSAVVTYPGSAEYATLPVNGASISGDVMTVTFEADGISNDFYSGGKSAKLALQISSGKSELLSDFANLYPRIGASLDFTRSKDIPVLKGARVSIPFKYAPNGDTYELLVSGNSNASLKDNPGHFNGYVNVDITDSDLASQSVTLTMNSGGEVVEEVLTFADAGKFDINYLAIVDYVGGEVNVSVDKSDSYGAYTMTLSNNSIGTNYQSKVGNSTTTETYYNTWIYEKNYGSQGTYIITENGPTKATVTGPEGTDIQLEVNNEGRNERTANLNFEIKNASPAVNGELTYTRSISITQKAYGTGFDESLYHSSGTVLRLKTATSNTSKHLNLVILGDGYKKSHLMKTGTFEGRARSAADVFLNAIDEDFRDRFNVYVIMRESSNSGVASGDMNGQRYTYYETFWNGSSVGISATGKNYVKNDVKSICTEASFDYYRSVAIVLMNSDADRGASDYEIDKTSTSNVGDGYASFGYTMVPANSYATNGLIKHEGVGHCLGRLGDEYPVDHHTVSLVNQRHDYGFYRNIATDKNYWSAFGLAGYTADEVDYVNYFDENGNVVKEGLYRSVNNSGIMFNNNGTFNAVSRWAIYDRIRKQTEGYGDYWNDFLIWDNKNRKK